MSAGLLQEWRIEEMVYHLGDKAVLFKVTGHLANDNKKDAWIKT